MLNTVMLLALLISGMAIGALGSIFIISLQPLVQIRITKSIPEDDLDATIYHLDKLEFMKDLDVICRRKHGIVKFVVAKKSDAKIED